MKVLVACESSGTVREAFRGRGHDAFSCDLLPADDGSTYHIKGDMFDALLATSWDLVIAHPPCTYLSSSGYHWNYRRPERMDLSLKAVDFFMRVTEIETNWVIENPIGIMSTRYRKPDVIVQPYMFGDDASKATCLWVKGVEPLVIPPRETWIQPRIVEANGKKYSRWANQTDSGQNRLAPSPDRWKERSKTYAGIAKAMAEQWG